jgi:hypothetical protein
MGHRQTEADIEKSLITESAGRFSELRFKEGYHWGTCARCLFPARSPRVRCGMSVHAGQPMVVRCSLAGINGLTTRGSEGKGVAKQTGIENEIVTADGC